MLGGEREGWGGAKGVCGRAGVLSEAGGGRGGEPSFGRLGLGWGRGSIPPGHRKGAEPISPGVGRGREARLMGPLSQAMTVEGKPWDLAIDAA